MTADCNILPCEPPALGWKHCSVITLVTCVHSYDLGLIGGALFNIRDEFHLSKAAEEWVVGSAKIGAFFGTFLGGAMMLHYGRRKTIAIDSLFYMAGPIVMAASYNFT